MASITYIKKLGSQGIHIDGEINLVKDILIEAPCCIRTIDRVYCNKIGAYTYNQKSPSFDMLNMIGRFCSIAENVHFGVGNHPTSFLSTSPLMWEKEFFDNRRVRKSQIDRDYLVKNEARITKTNELRILENLKKDLITVGNDVWIGKNSLIMNGVTIGDGAVIGEKTVVTKDVPPFAIVVGTPAKVVRYRFDERTIERLLRIKWWDYGLPILEGVEWTNIDQALNQLEQKIADGIALWKPKLFKITKDGKASEASPSDAEKIAYNASARSGIGKPINHVSIIENAFVKAESEMLDCYHHIKLPNYTTAYYGQNFEDVIILGILRSIYKENFDFKDVTYIEIGANHPISGSNTYMFYKKGAQGVLVEPNKDLHELLERVRGKDKLIKSCVTERANCNKVDYYYLNYNELNTTNKMFIEKWNEKCPDKTTSVVQKVSLPAVSINEILSENFTDGNIDIFSIDIEGNEMAIIETINFTKYTPKIICMEWNSVFNGSKEDVKTIMSNKGYLLHSDTIVNGIFVLKKYF